MIRKLRLLDFLNPLVSFNLSYLVFISAAPFIFWILEIELGYEKGTYFCIYSYPLFFSFMFILVQALITKNKFKLVKIETKLKPNKFIINSFLGVLGFYMLFYIAGDIPLFHNNAETYRVQFAKGKGTFILLFTALIYYGSLNYIIIKGVNLISIFLILVGLSTILFLGFRSPALYFLIACLLAFSSNNKKLLSRGALNYKLIIILVLLFPISSLIGLYRLGFTLSSSLELLVNMKHLFLVNSDNLNLIISKYNPSDYQYGKSFINDFLVAIPGTNNEFSGVKLKDYLGVNFVGQTMTVTLPGEGYINFGYLGVIMHSIFMGTIISVLNELFRTNNKMTSRFLLIVLNIFCFRIVTGGIMPILIFSIIPIIIIMFLNSFTFKYESIS